MNHVPESVRSSQETALSTPSNTGVERAPAFMDYLTFTVPLNTDPGELIRLLGGDQFAKPGLGGKFGYRQSIEIGAIQILFDGRDDMGICVHISGKGCRELEAMGYDAVTFLKRIEALGAKPSRIDMAIDDVFGILQIEEIDACVEEGRCCTRSGRWTGVKTGLNAVRDGRSVYLGAPDSETRLRIYERKAEGSDNSRRVRVELQLRDKRAQLMLEQLIEHGAPAIQTILGRLFDFKLRGGSKQRCRWPSAPWWLNFLRCEVTLPRPTLPLQSPSLQRSLSWVHRQVAPTLAKLVFSVEDGGELLVDLILEGWKRLKRQHRTAIYRLLAARAAEGDGCCSSTDSGQTVGTQFSQASTNPDGPVLGSVEAEDNSGVLDDHGQPLDEHGFPWVARENTALSRQDVEH